ncbi:hypothetical protein [Cohnella soli]|uniref:DUF3137 domain-containing protein n=1 Tax=Cohnella soli TaxID=425005 RepID=A0ABW0I286_9BACL
MESTKRNYYDDLQKTAKPLDDWLILMRMKEDGHWFWRALKGPVKMIINVFKKVKVAAIIKSIATSTLPVVVGALSWLSNLALWESIGIGAAAAVAVYVICIFKYLSLMCTPGADEFHIGYFKKKRKAEYDRYWSRTVDTDFTFEGLHKFLGSVFGFAGSEKMHYEKQLEMLIEVKDKEIAEYKAELAEYEEDIKDFAEQQEQSDLTLEYITDVLKDLNVTLFRMANGIMDFNDLGIVAGLTIYEYSDELLHKVADVRTSGVSPQTIHIEDPRYKDFSIVQMVHSSDRSPKMMEVRPGYHLITNRMRMHNHVTWYITFHVDAVRNPKALSLLLPSDMIEIREIYRMFHALCLILQRRELSAKDGVQDELTGSRREST